MSIVDQEPTSMSCTVAKESKDFLTLFPLLILLMLRSFDHDVSCYLHHTILSIFHISVTLLHAYMMKVRQKPDIHNFHSKYLLPWCRLIYHHSFFFNQTFFSHSSSAAQRPYCYTNRSIRKMHAMSGSDYTKKNEKLVRRLVWRNWLEDRSIF